MKRLSKKPEHITSNWSTEQDSFLIENSVMVIEELINHLPFTEDEIIKRKEVLGLTRRHIQMRKFLSNPS
ncbi:acyl-CoA thioesterase [Acinetobacter guillouiae]|uniref:Acyl-CoA thioesterase n=1 Tax=Acinetobacter guillouiae TaxID=106649 RepID=A0A8X8GCY5_ACIGI|nr:acyl-CoA thioesterase [Acinetobacter guillouiae]MCF0264293.1 acyl-CoA thioesterase [Acinetobacter guillouiae]